MDEILGVYTGGPFGRRKDEPGHSPDDYKKFRDLIQRMLDYNPVKRLCAVEAVRHPFLRKQPTPSEDVMGNTIRNPRYDVGSSSTSDHQNSSRLSFADNANVEELANIQRHIETDDFLPDEVGNSSMSMSNLMQPIDYYKYLFMKKFYGH